MSIIELCCQNPDPSHLFSVSDTSRLFSVPYCDRTFDLRFNERAICRPFNFTAISFLGRDWNCASLTGVFTDSTDFITTLLFVRHLFVMFCWFTLHSRQWNLDFRFQNWPTFDFLFIMHSRLELCPILSGWVFFKVSSRLMVKTYIFYYVSWGVYLQFLKQIADHWSDISNTPDLFILKDRYIHV